jgi:hypothetical protein
MDMAVNKTGSRIQSPAVYNSIACIGTAHPGNSIVNNGDIALADRACIYIDDITVLDNGITGNDSLRRLNTSV